MRLARQSQVASSQGTSIVSLESPLDFKVHWLVALLCNDFLWHLRQIHRANYAERRVLNPAVRGCGDDFWTLSAPLSRSRCFANSGASVFKMIAPTRSKYAFVAG